MKKVSVSRRPTDVSMKMVKKSFQLFRLPTLLSPSPCIISVLH